MTGWNEMWTGQLTSIKVDLALRPLAGLMGQTSIAASTCTRVINSVYTGHHTHYYLAHLKITHSRNMQQAVDRERSGSEIATHFKSLSFSIIVNLLHKQMWMVVTATDRLTLLVSQVTKQLDSILE